MRVRIWAVMAVAMLAVVAVSCSGGRSAQGPVGTPIPSKTLRPTFTHTPAKPTEIPPTATPAATATPEPPTSTPEPTAVPPTPTPEKATFKVTSATVNVRSGPGTSYSAIGKLKAGDSFEIAGKNDTGDWWQFAYNGDPAWVAAEMVEATGGDTVKVAQNIPALPTAIKRASAPAPKKPAAPASPPAPATKFALRGAPQAYINTNNYITVRCRVSRDLTETGGIPGTLRVSGPAGVKEVAFGNRLVRANTGMADEANQPIFNSDPDCKIEFNPSVEGQYTAVLIEGGQPVSDPATFTVTGDWREFVVRWNPR